MTSPGILRGGPFLHESFAGRKQEHTKESPDSGDCSNLLYPNTLLIEFLDHAASKYRNIARKESTKNLKQVNLTWGVGFRNLGSTNQLPFCELGYTLSFVRRWREVQLRIGVFTRGARSKSV
jgi:hypothetical protein